MEKPNSRRPIIEDVSPARDDPFCCLPPEPPPPMMKGMVPAITPPPMAAPDPPELSPPPIPRPDEPGDPRPLLLPPEDPRAPPPPAPAAESFFSVIGMFNDSVEGLWTIAEDIIRKERQLQSRLDLLTKSHQLDTIFVS